MKAVAITLSAWTLFGTLVATLFALFVATFCDENCTPDDRQPIAFVWPGLLALGCALLLLTAIALDRAALAVASYAGQAGAALVLLSHGLSESDHSDGKLLVFALVVELPGAVAVAVSIRNASERPADAQSRST